MGGTNEKVVNPPSINNAVSVPIRIHENSGEVHLHDDKNGKKFSCPVAEFYSAWKQAKATGFSSPSFIFGHDGKNNPLSAKFEKTVVAGKVDVAISFEPVSYGDTVNKIDDFVAGH